jgi:serine/threonine protein phosphatase 1
MTASAAPNTFLRLPPNLNGRDFVVGDIHGHFELVEDVMRQVAFDPLRDRMVAVGDLVDRGPNSHHVLDWLQQPWFFSVRGNHEQMILDHHIGTGEEARHRKNGGAWFHDSDHAVRRAIALRLEALPFALEVATAVGKVGVVHAEPPLLPGQCHWNDVVLNLSGGQGGDVQQLAQRQALYSRARIQQRDVVPVQGVQRVYVGHTSVPEPVQLGNVVYLDTGCSWADGKLSAIELTSGAVITAEYEQLQSSW